MRGLGVLLGTWIVMILIGGFRIGDSVVQSYISGGLVPVSIRINKIDLVQDITPGLIINNDWQIVDDKINYLVGSGNSKEGNIVLYAHNRKGLFGELDKIEINDVIEVFFDQQKFEYRVVESKSVNNKQIEILDVDNKDLTLFTCDGVFDLKRWMVKAVLI